MIKKIYVPLLMLGFGIASCDTVSDKVSEAATEAVLESLSGDSLEIDFHGKDGEINLEVTNEDGTTTSWGVNTEGHELPDDFPSEIHLLSHSKRGMISVVDSPDGKFVVINDTVYLTLTEATLMMKENMKSSKLEAEVNTGSMSTLSYQVSETKTFTISLIEENEGFIMAQYGVMY